MCETMITTGSDCGSAEWINDAVEKMDGKHTKILSGIIICKLDYVILKV